jgi:RNA polymerase-binding transcription factor DksA
MSFFDWFTPDPRKNIQKSDIGQDKCDEGPKCSDFPYGPGTESYNEYKKSQSSSCPCKSTEPASITYGFCAKCNCRIDLLNLFYMPNVGYCCTQCKEGIKASVGTGHDITAIVGDGGGSFKFGENNKSSKETDAIIQNLKELTEKNGEKIRKLTDDINNALKSINPSTLNKAPVQQSPLKSTSNNIPSRALVSGAIGSGQVFSPAYNSGFTNITITSGAYFTGNIFN